MAAPASPVRGVELRTLRVNGLTTRVAVAGPSDGPLVLLMHGWPDLWYGWRKQLPALAEAGYRVVAPDMRGYGGTDAPADFKEYSLPIIARDMLGLLEEFGRESCFLVGHDFGANVAYRLGLMEPNKFAAVVGMSVVYTGHRPTLTLLKESFGDPRDQENGKFFYILFHSLPEATAHYDGRLREAVRMFYAFHPGCEIARPPAVTSDLMWVDGELRGTLDRVPEPKDLPPWFSEADLEYYVQEFTPRGFHGSLNWYRVTDFSYEQTRELAERKFKQPVLFIGGAEDPVVALAGGERAVAGLRNFTEGEPETLLIPGAGHWVQQEVPDEVNARLLAFLKAHPEVAAKARPRQSRL